MNAAESDRRVVLPQWLPFRRAATQRESTIFEYPHKPIDFGPTHQAFLESLEEFRTSAAPYIAVELMGTAQVLGQTEIARELANFVLSQPFLSGIVHSQANAILGKSVSDSHQDERTLLKGTKRRVREYPHDALAWIEQARLYTVIGSFHKARASVLAALQLAPGDRYITRCAIRFFVHFGEWDEALRHAQRAFAQNPDPLIFGPLLSVSSRVGKLPPRLKSQMQTALSASEQLLHSETLEAAGTLELMSGSDQRAKPYFRQAWRDPTHPVIGHSQWILREHLPTLALEQRIDFWSSKEAVSWLRYTMLDFSKTITDTNAWALEEPYSRAPHILGSSAACLIGKFDVAVAMAKRGLLANPHDDILRNNLAFAHLRKGSIQDGEKALIPLLGKLNHKSEVALSATYGLLLMCKGDQLGGAHYYGEAINRALEQKNRRLAVRATLNFLVSLLDTAKTVDIELLKSTKAALVDINDPACLGAATVIADKLASSDMTGSDELSRHAREFSAVVSQEREKLKGSIAANLLAAAPKSASVSPGQTYLA